MQVKIERATFQQQQLYVPWSEQGARASQRHAMQRASVSPQLSAQNCRNCASRPTLPPPPLASTVSTTVTTTSTLRARITATITASAVTHLWWDPPPNTRLSCTAVTHCMRTTSTPSLRPSLQSLTSGGTLRPTQCASALPRKSVKSVILPASIATQEQQQPKQQKQQQKQRQQQQARAATEC
jgi:hypothetical protein